MVFESTKGGGRFAAAPFRAILALAMKVILLQDVAKIGRKHAVVDVPAGYAQNQLIPKGRAKPATPANLKAAERLTAERHANESAAETKFFAAKQALEGKTVVVRGLKSDRGHLFAAVKPEAIIAAAKEDGIDIVPAMLALPGVIKTTGEHEAELAHGRHRFSFKVIVE